MRTIGIVGGVAWPSSLVYYRQINEMIAARLGGSGRHCAKLVLAQTDFDEVERRQVEGRWDIVGDLIAEQGNRLKAAGADFYIVACNTVHTAAEFFVDKIDLPFIHIVDPAADQAIRQGYRQVGLLGSRYTMRGAYFIDRLEHRYGLDVLVAEGQHETNVHDALYQELTKGVFLPETRQKFLSAIASLQDRGAEAVILGCTEFGMLVDAEDSPIPLIDTTIAHAAAAVDYALES